MHELLYCYNICYLSTYTYEGKVPMMRMYIRWTAMKPYMEPLKTSKRNKNIGKNWSWNSYRNHIIMILVNYNTACLAILVEHNLRMQLNVFKNPKLWKCMVFSNVWVFLKAEKAKFLLINQVLKMDFRLIIPFQHCKRPFLPYGPYDFLESWRVEWSPFSKFGF